MKEALKVWPQLSNYPGLTLKATITSIICAGWKVYGEKETHCINAWDFSRWKKDINDDYTVCKEIYKVLKTADAVVTHNGKRFDWKYLQTRLMFHKFDPLHKIHHIDTCSVAKQNLLSFNNRLGTLGQWLSDDKKLENGGWGLWVQVANKEKKALKLMEEYCIQDVDLLEKIFTRLKPLITNIPNYNLWRTDEQRMDNTNLCPKCGSEDISFNGWRTTQTLKYQRLKCNECGGSSRANIQGLQPRSF
ncbi:MAG: ribonuclease H-like domain-containing protein [Pseudoalteromonas sp.]